MTFSIILLDQIPGRTFCLDNTQFWHFKIFPDKKIISNFICEDKTIKEKKNTQKKHTSIYCDQNRHQLYFADNTLSFYQKQSLIFRILADPQVKHSSFPSLGRFYWSKARFPCQTQIRGRVLLHFPGIFVSCEVGGVLYRADQLAVPIHHSWLRSDRLRLII